MFTGGSLDATALERQNRRIERLKDLGVNRSTVLVHQECKTVFDGLRPHLVDPGKSEALAQLLLQLQDKKFPTNVAQVRQLSPFRYPGGKTWLVPEVRKWLMSSKRTPSVFVEPFAGDRVEENLTPVGRMLYAASTMICVPASLAHHGPALGAQAGEARIREIVTAGGFIRFRRATQTRFNLVFEARP